MGPCAGMLLVQEPERVRQGVDIQCALFAQLFDALPTGYRSEESVDAIRLGGALLVLLGSATCALGSARTKESGT